MTPNLRRLAGLPLIRSDASRRFQIKPEAGTATARALPRTLSGATHASGSDEGAPVRSHYRGHRSSRPMGHRNHFFNSGKDCKQTVVYNSSPGPSKGSLSLSVTSPYTR
ncbi:unnamed protein product, partial [Iphiclides podalirius]